MHYCIRPRHARISRVADSGLGGAPHKAIRHNVAHPSNSTERSSAGLNPKYAGFWTLTLTYSCTVCGWPVKHKQIRQQHSQRRPLPGNQPAVLLVSEESSNETMKQGSLGSYSHVEVARNGPSPSQDIHPNHLSVLLLPAGQPLSLPRLN